MLMPRNAIRCSGKVCFAALLFVTVCRLLMFTMFKETTKFDFEVAFGRRTRVDLRIILLTFDRSNSLIKCLNTLNMLRFEDPSTTRTLDIWIDRNKSDHVDTSTYEVARKYRWPHGTKTVNIHRRHAGVFGQWIQTWVPENWKKTNPEIAFFLEDDIDVSPFAWKWLKAVKKFYANRKDISMFCLQDDNAVKMDALGNKVEVIRDSRSPVFLYAVPGSWGCSPEPKVWADFRLWFLEKQMLAKLGDPFRPYVLQAPIHTAWYKVFEKQNRADSMWTMWFIYYCRENKLFGLYSNLPEYYGTTNVSLVVNRKESGMHYKTGKERKNAAQLLLRFWDDKFINFPEQLPKIGFDGKRIYD